MATQTKKGTQELTKGFIKDNPLLALLLGTCPALAVTTSAINGLGMGIAMTIVLIMSNAVISILRKFIPDKVRIPSYITIIASLVTIVQFLMEAYAPELNKSLGIFVPLITVNCIILGRAEAFANKNTLGSSLLDALGMGGGYTLALLFMGIVREVLGNGSCFGWVIPFMGGDHTLQPMTIMILPPGGFMAFGLAMIVSKQLVERYYARKPEKIQTAKSAHMLLDDPEERAKAEEAKKKAPVGPGASVPAPAKVAVKAEAKAPAKEPAPAKASAPATPAGN